MLIYELILTINVKVCPLFCKLTINIGLWKIIIFYNKCQFYVYNYDNKCNFIDYNFVKIFWTYIDYKC